ncbi:MAG TPA: D-alanyl-D-alanine carboxypeptidase [Aliiroseovarius sp.]|nr:D-alanyl-D-alanine carboxypeptidase [Aliiroseovarius sp.]
MRHSAIAIFFGFLSSLILVVTSAQAFETRAKAAFVYDLATDTVLLEKQADVPLPPASMSKLMTLNMLFEALEDGRLSLDTRLSVSERAQAMGGSTMFLNTSDRPTVEELIKGIIVNSGNDACVVVAEALGGTEEAFARMMTERAKALGMENSNFANSSGWPDPAQRMSMRDLAILATRLIEEFPQYYPYFSIAEFPFDGRAPDNRFNRNPLLKLGIGADGLKTGHTAEAGYGLVGSALQGNRRIVFVVSGLDSKAARAEEAEAVVNWAFRQFALKTVARAGVKVAEADVWLGDAPSVGLVPANDVTLLIPALQRDGVEAVISWTSPLEAPISQGQEIATMLIQRDGLSDTTVAMLAENAVGPAGFMPRFQVALDKVFGMAMDAIGGQGKPAEPPAPLTN